MGDDELQNLQNRIDKLKTQDEPPSKSKKSKIDALSVGIELVAGVIVGVIIGVFLDKIFASAPIFLIICIVFGITASFRTIWQKMNKNDAS